MAMAGFPYHALDTYLPKLIRAGERVAICDQLEAPEHACAWLVGGSTKAFGKAMHYFAIIFLFALGAGLGSLALAPMGSRAIWLSCLLLFISFCLMFLKEDIEELEEFEHLEHEEALKK